MQPRFLSKQFFSAFTNIFIINTAVYRTNSSALRLIMKTYTFCAFVRDNVIHLI